MNDAAPAAACPPAPLPDLARPAARRLHALTALRFIAAAAIVLQHSSSLGLLPKNTFSPLLLFQAVSFFFVLSGFILAYVYPRLDSLPERRRFFLARFARLWPAHLAAILLTLLIMTNPIGYPHHGFMSWFRPISLNLLMLQSWFPFLRDYGALNPAAWSISTEFGFYLFFPFLIANFARSWWWKLPAAAALTAAMIALAHFPGLPVYANPIPAELNRVSVVGLIYSNPLCRLFEFVLGMSVALVWRKTETRWHAGRLVGTLLELIAIAAVAINMYYADAFSTWASHSNLLGAPGLMWLQEAGSVCLSFALLIFIIAREQGWISRALSAPLAVLLGEISFSVYLVHALLLEWYSTHADPFAYYPPWLLNAFYWTIVLVLSYFIWSAIERPMRQAIVGAFSTRRPASPPRPALELPGGLVRSLFASLLAPRPRIVLASALLSALLLSAVIIQSNVAPPLDAIPIAQIDLPPNTIPESRGVRFGNQFLLLAAAPGPRTSAGQDLTLYWQTLRPVTLRYDIAIHMLDSTGAIIGHADHPQNPDEPRVMPGYFWIDTVHLPPDLLDRITEIGIALTDGPNNALPADRGPRDWANFRLRLPLSTVPSTTLPNSQ